jgi:CreA protein
MPNIVRTLCLAALTAAVLGAAGGGALAQSPDVIFKKSTVWKMLTPDDKLVTYAIDDPGVEGVACFFTAAERGGVSGMLGLAEETSDVSLACRQVGPIRIKEKFEQGAVVLRQSRSFFFKKMQIVRGCDTKRNVLVYLVYSDKLIEGSPSNSTSAVPIMPWGATNDVPRCADSVQ